MQYMGKSHKLKKLLQKHHIIDISFYNENSRILQKSLPCLLQRWVIELIEIVYTHHTISAPLECGEDIIYVEPSNSGEEIIPTPTDSSPIFENKEAD